MSEEEVCYWRDMRAEYDRLKRDAEEADIKRQRARETPKG